MKYDFAIRNRISLCIIFTVFFLITVSQIFDVHHQILDARCQYLMPDVKFFDCRHQMLSLGIKIFDCKILILAIKELTQNVKY